MSRIGKKIMEIPNGVTVEFNKDTGETKVKGPLGELSETLLPYVDLKIKDNVATVTVEKETEKTQRAMWGTSRALIANMVEGVTQGFKKELELNGVGFKMELGKDLILYVGFSHPITISIPDSIKLQLDKNVLTGESIDKQLIGDFFMKIHNIKSCDPYKQKGFKIPGRYYQKKVGKKAAKAE